MFKEEFIILITTVLLIVAIVIGAIGQYKTRTTCLSMGYPNYSYSMLDTSYCIKRQDQTDVVIPLSK